MTIQSKLIKFKKHLHLQHYLNFVVAKILKAILALLGPSRNYAARCGGLVWKSMQRGIANPAMDAN